MTNCHPFYLDMWKIFCIFKGGRAGTLYRSEVFLNYSQRISTFITNNLYRTYRRDENNSKKVVKYLAMLNICCILVV